ncbi:hypothetical protein LIER_40211 [Lithospermum erythrorhizon]|uniref:Uncharacterized protein n=1 Tax=Lithospermum erythrorhizon TaxID=34254 RepID=A0AAV3QTH1_LITER
MNKLSLLELRGDFFKGNYNVNDSQPFGQLGNKLRWFSWSKYPGEYLPKKFHPMNLVRLLMEDSQIKETPDFSHMPSLEWIYFDKYQHLCCLKLHQLRKKVPHEILQAFSEWKLMSNMLRKREKPFKVCIPRWQILSWFQYQFSKRSVTMFLQPLFEWYTDELRGFVISGINADFEHESVWPTYDRLYNYQVERSPGSLHIVVVYIPIDSIIRDIGDWEGENECTLLKLKSRRYVCTEMVETSPRWGLILVYSKGEVNEVDPHQLIIVTEYDIPDQDHGTFRVKLAGSTC